MRTTIKFNGRNNNIYLDKVDNEDKIFNYKKNQYHLRDQLDIILSECFPKSKNYELFSGLSYDSKIKINKREEIRRLEKEMFVEERKISYLNKKIEEKFTKIKDLRKIIDRIAYEKSFDNSVEKIFKNIKGNIKNNRRSGSLDYLERNSCNISNSTAHADSSGDTENEGIIEDYKRKGNQNCGKPLYSQVKFNKS